MNEAKAIEIALYTVLRKYAKLGGDTTIRVWQSLRTDSKWDEEKDRSFPLIDIRCAPPRSNSDQYTMGSEATIQTMTSAEEDRDHAVVSGLYGEVKKVLDSLMGQFLTGNDGDELTLFKATLTKEAGECFEFGGVSFGEPREPFDDSGYLIMTVGFLIHHSRTDY